jgi:hypothetical protein
VSLASGGHRNSRFRAPPKATHLGLLACQARAAPGFARGAGNRGPQRHARRHRRQVWLRPFHHPHLHLARALHPSDCNMEGRRVRPFSRGRLRRFGQPRRRLGHRSYQALRWARGRRGIRGIRGPIWLAVTKHGHAPTPGVIQHMRRFALDHRQTQRPKPVCDAGTATRAAKPHGSHGLGWRSIPLIPCPSGPMMPPTGG